MYLMLLIHTLKTVKMVDFMFCKFITVKLHRGNIHNRQEGDGGESNAVGVKRKGESKFPGQQSPRAQAPQIS